jgi:hypothetical protein
MPSFSLSGLQDAHTPPSPRVGEGGWGDEGHKRTGMRTPVLGFRTPILPLLPLWEKEGEGCSQG